MSTLVGEPGRASTSLRDPGGPRRAPDMDPTGGRNPIYCNRFPVSPATPGSCPG